MSYRSSIRSLVAGSNDGLLGMTPISPDPAIAGGSTLGIDVKRASDPLANVLRQCPLPVAVEIGHVEPLFPNDGLLGMTPISPCYARGHWAPVDRPEMPGSEPFTQLERER